MVADKIASYSNANFTANESLQKTRQIVLLYDSVIRYLERAKMAIGEKDYETRFNMLQKASNIIVGMHSALDFEKGGDISKTLSSFYGAIDLRIININVSNDIEEIDAISKEVALMREAWDKIDQEQGNASGGGMQQVQADAPPAQGQPNPEPTDYSA